MNDKTFESYQKRMLDAMQNPNQHSNDPFTKLSNKLDNLKKFVNCRTFSKAEFKKEVNKLFTDIDSSDEETRHIKNTLISFSSTKEEAIKTISELQSMIKPISVQIGSLSAVADIANEYMAEIEKKIFK